ncbi:MAG: HAD family phosphatase [Patescibacteria group bacterium]|jgi:HAD superfamily hydrolase (TIGR01509 family)
MTNKLLLPKSLQHPFKAVLFDLDGTLLDSEDVHYFAFREALKEFGYNFDELAKQAHFQGSFKKAFQDIGHELGFDHEKFDKIYERKVELTLQISPNEIDKVAGITSFLELLKERAVPMGVVTNSERRYAGLVMTAHDLLDYFNPVITGDELSEPKPAPKGYLRAAEQLNINPQDILVFENSDAGITAAKAAGMCVIAIRTTDVGNYSNFEAADLGIDDFADNLLNDLTFNTK